MESRMSRAPAGRAADSSVLRIEGRDALAVLHRISTQSLREMNPGEARATLFCDPRGRLLHRAIVAVTADRAVWLARDDAPGSELMAFVDRNVFRDDLRASDLGGTWSVHWVPGGPGLAAGTILERDGCPRAIQPAATTGYVLEPRGPASRGPAERLRIHEGRPRHGHEIAEAFNPFEVGIAHEVHLSKGCFTGQEALLRLMTYGSVRRRLVRLSGSGPPPLPPVEVSSQGRTIGRVTSAAEDEEGWTALAVIAHSAADAPGPIEVQGRCALLARVFPETRPLGLP